MESTGSVADDQSSTTPGGGPGVSPSAYFTKLLEEHPRWLSDRKNDKIYEQWKRDYGQDTVPQNYKQILSNIKTRMRKERDERKAKRGSRKSAEAAEPASAPAPRSSRISTKNLEILEGMLDDAVLHAMNTGKDDLDSVIGLLKTARRQIAIKLGQ